MLSKPIKIQIKHKTRFNLWIMIKIKLKDIRFKQFFFYSSYKLGIVWSLSYKYRYHECIAACNSDLCNKGEILMYNINFFIFFDVFKLQFDLLHFFLFFGLKSIYKYYWILDRDKMMYLNHLRLINPL
jgi:hypothetical protein